jgi:hypothetical protein
MEFGETERVGFNAEGTESAEKRKAREVRAKEEKERV